MKRHFQGTGGPPNRQRPLKSNPRAKILPYTRSAIAKSGSKKSIVERRAIPEIYVRVNRSEAWGYRSQYARAHLRNRNGYLLLQWRNSTKIRSFYLGKSKKTSPTVELEGAPDPRGRRRPSPDFECRAKHGGKQR